MGTVYRRHLIACSDTLYWLFFVFAIYSQGRSTTMTAERLAALQALGMVFETYKESIYNN